VDHHSFERNFLSFPPIYNMHVFSPPGKKSAIEENHRSVRAPRRPYFVMKNSIGQVGKAS